MTQVLAVVLGQPCAVLQAATRPGAALADGAALALRQLPFALEAVAAMAVPPAFRLAWIFADAAALDSPVLHACHQRLCRIAPVTIAIHHTHDDPVQPAENPGFPGGVILQAYTDATFPLVQALITDFAAKENATAPGAKSA